MKKLLKNAISFCVIRNPFDKIVSSYTWLYHTFCTNFEEYINTVKQLVEKDKGRERIIPGEVRPLDSKIFVSNQFLPQCHYIDDNMNYVLHFENLEKDVMKFQSFTNIRFDLRRVNQSTRTHYRDYYNQKIKDIVAGLYADDMKLFNYTF